MEITTLTALLVAAASIAFVHTVAGPDHYIPFVAMSQVGRWSLGRTMLVTFACGIAHVLSSVLLGLAGIAVGAALAGLEWFEGLRGDAAGWMLLGFGTAYMLWGIRQAIRGQTHKHWHSHPDGTVHDHDHAHVGEHAHVHTTDAAGRTAHMTPWILFTIFVFGPCEPLIPLLMYPAARLSYSSVLLVTAVFSIITIGTMLSIVAIGYLGFAKLIGSRLERYSHAAAGFALTACGIAVVAGL